mmetsp:Transcript_8418/g.16161  ORF Transcript_8418/g.16161 Transcript_8418/m.16161 type:complete len:219 (-) Transcript_8418:409-1065(-)
MAALIVQLSSTSPRTPRQTKSSSPPRPRSCGGRSRSQKGEWSYTRRTRKEKKCQLPLPASSTYTSTTSPTSSRSSSSGSRRMRWGGARRREAQQIKPSRKQRGREWRRPPSKRLRTSSGRRERRMRNRRHRQDSMRHGIVGRSSSARLRLPRRRWRARAIAMDPKRRLGSSPWHVPFRPPRTRQAALVILTVQIQMPNAASTVQRIRNKIIQAMLPYS